MSGETELNRENADSPKSRVGRLLNDLQDRDFRHGYMARQLKQFLAAQFRALRGDKTQVEFAKEIDKHQPEVSKLEKSSESGSVNVQTLIEIAERLDLGLIVRFVNYQTFLRMSSDFSDAAYAPEPYSHEAIAALAREQEAQSRRSALHAVPSSKQPPLEVSVLKLVPEPKDDLSKQDGPHKKAESAVAEAA